MSELLSGLKSARGQSRHVVVTFLDIRGFSSFAKVAESTDAAAFLKCAYSRMLADHFSNADFVKLTGDGMLVIHEYFDRVSLQEAVQKAVDEGIKLIDVFPTISADDPMVNVPVPTNLGIGLSRGSATALVTDFGPLDFSGRPLNLAARLMDMARPLGLLFDESFGFELLDDATQLRFTRSEVYVDGIAEEEPIDVFCLDRYTIIPERNRRPINSYTQITDGAFTTSIGELKRYGFFQHLLKQKPIREDEIWVQVTYPEAAEDGTPTPKLRWAPRYKARYREIGGQPRALLDYDPVYSAAIERGARDDWPVDVELHYLVVENALGDSDTSSAGGDRA